MKRTGCSFLLPSVKHLEIKEALTWCPVCRGLPPLLNKDLLGFYYQPNPIGADQEEAPCVDRARKHGHAGCYSEAPKVLTSSVIHVSFIPSINLFIVTGPTRSASAIKL